MEPPKLFSDLLDHLVKTEKDPVIVRKTADMLNEFNNGDKVCRLKKSLYGFRQAGRQWHVKLREALREFGAIPSNGDPCLYFKGQGNKITLITVYVDDFIVASRCAESISHLSKVLSSRFDVKDLGSVSQCLGIKFTLSSNQVTMSQESYIDELLRRFGITDANSVTTPMDVNVPYRELAIATRLDISFAASCLGQFNNAYGKAHWNAAKRVLRYLKGTKELGLIYTTDSQPLRGFMDSDWGACPDDRRSYSGFVFLLSGSAISWES